MMMQRVPVLLIVCRYSRAANIGADAELSRLEQDHAHSALGSPLLLNDLVQPPLGCIENKWLQRTGLRPYAQGQFTESGQVGIERFN